LICFIALLFQPYSEEDSSSGEQKRAILPIFALLIRTEVFQTTALFWSRCFSQWPIFHTENTHLPVF